MNRCPKNKRVNKNKRNQEKEIQGYVFGQKRDWKKLQRGKPRYGCTATLQLVSAFVFGDPYYFTKTPSSIMWENLQHEVIIGTIDKKNGLHVSPSIHAACAPVEYNAYKVLVEICSTQIINSDGTKEYMTTRVTANDDQNDLLMAPMSFVYRICDNLVKARAKGWRPKNGYKKHRDFL